MRKLVRVGAIIMFVLGVTGLAFGIVLLASANSIHNGTVASLEDEGAPTTIGELRELRDELRDTRWAFYPPPYEFNPFNPGDQAGLNLLIMEKGVGLSLTNLSRAMMYQYAGIGILVLGLGLATAGVVQYKMAGRMT
jgi:hypothetical protein